MGIPDLTGASPQFAKKHNPHTLLLQERDIDEKTINYFANLVKAEDTTKTKAVLFDLLSYSGGHTFPFLKIAEYVCQSYREECLGKDIVSLICNRVFVILWSQMVFTTNL